MSKLENVTKLTVCGEHRNPPMVSQEASPLKKTVSMIFSKVDAFNPFCLVFYAPPFK